MEKTLVVLAAGMASRFGSLKQIKPVGPSGEFLLDYSVYDAYKAGFTKVVFVIREENYEDFSSTVGKRLEGKIKVEYAFQKMDPRVPAERIKPLGTGQALLCAKDKIKGPFALISADDYYGQGTYQVLSDYMDKNYTAMVMGYKIGETIFEGEEVKRGVIIEENGHIKNIIESKVSINGDKVLCTPLDETKPSFKMPKDASVSMLMFAFQKEIFTYLENDFEKFMQTADLNKDEFLLPDVVNNLIAEGKVELIKTSEKWIGMTYKDDMQVVVNKINEYIDQGLYQKDLWGIENERKSVRTN